MITTPHLTNRIVKRNTKTIMRHQIDDDDK